MQSRVEKTLPKWQGTSITGAALGRIFVSMTIVYKYKKTITKLKGKQGWSTKKHTYKGSKDGNKGQGLTLLLFVLSFSCLFARHLKLF